MMRYLRMCSVCLAMVGAATCGSARNETGVYALYRNSVLDSLARYHVATFDAKDGDLYNRENCEVARQLFQAQPGVKTRFWCEKGLFLP